MHQWIGITIATKLSISYYFTFLETKNSSSVGHCKQDQQWFTSPATAFLHLLLQVTFFCGLVRKCPPNIRQLSYAFGSNYLVFAIYMTLMDIVFYFYFRIYFLRASKKQLWNYKVKLQCVLKTTC